MQLIQNNEDINLEMYQKPLIDRMTVSYFHHQEDNLPKISLKKAISAPQKQSYLPLNYVKSMVLARCAQMGFNCSTMQALIRLHELQMHNTLPYTLQSGQYYQHSISYKIDFFVDKYLEHQERAHRMEEIIANQQKKITRSASLTVANSIHDFMGHREGASSKRRISIDQKPNLDIEQNPNTTLSNANTIFKKRIQQWEQIKAQNQEFFSELYKNDQGYQSQKKQQYTQQQQEKLNNAQIQFQKKHQKIIDEFPISEELRDQLLEIAFEQEKLQEYQKEKENQQKPFFECSICYNGFTEEECNKKTVVIGECSERFCIQCVVNKLSAQINDGQVLLMQCPNCNVQWREDEILKILGETKEINLMQKYTKFKNKKMILSNEDARECVRVDCEEVLIGGLSAKNNLDATQPNKLTCHKCHQTMCFLCKAEWHDNVSCIKAMDQAFLKFRITKIVQNCPKCQSPIEKNTGCNHITCVYCQQEFCWLCLEPYKYGHFKYKWVYFGIGGCRQYDDRTPNQYRTVQQQILTILLSCLKMLAFLLLIVVGVPLYFAIYSVVAIFAAFLGPYIVWKEKIRSYPRRKPKIHVIFLCILLGIILQPVTYIILIVPISFMILYAFIKERVLR